jgi:hypothetical protein
VVDLGVVGLWVCCWASQLGDPFSGASNGSSGKGFLTLTVYAASEGPILTRSRAAAAQSGGGSDFRPAIVKGESGELPTPADNGEGSSSGPFSTEGQGVFWTLGAPLARWFPIEEDSEDDMEGSSMGGGPAKMVKFTGSNRIMTVSELRNLVY